MQTSTYPPLPGGTGRRASPAGLAAGARLSRIADVDDALGLVAAELAGAERELSLLVISDVAAVPAVAGHLVAAGGKRLRPALTALGAVALGYSRPIHRLMCAGELLHLGSLLHDDVVDDGTERRGRPAAHMLYGNAVSVLTGDFCLARAVLLASEEGGHACVTALSRAVVEMAEGEVLQLQRAGDLHTDRDTYFDVVERKSAALIAWCVAAAAHASEDAPRAAALEHFGRAVGIAFQITDDVIDYFDGTGKAAGADLRDRKVTLPLLFAMEADSTLRDELSEPGDDAAIAGWIGRIRLSGALDQALAEARARVEAASVALDVLPDGPGRDALLVLGRHLVERVR